jgi:hypothetical protein
MLNADVQRGLQMAGFTPVTRIEEKFAAAPNTLSLLQNYPNPFNPVTTIRFSLPRREYVTLKVFAISGEEIATLVNEELGRGDHAAVFDGQKIVSGIYFYVLAAGKFSQTRKAVLLK